jgi:hypothetical protein
MKLPTIQSFMLRWLSLLALVALAACSGGSDSSSVNRTPMVFTATLNGAQETPPNASTAEGIGVLIFHPGDRTFTASVITSGMTETVAHIHEAPPGVPGPIIFPLTKEQGRVVWNVRGTLTEAQETTLRAGNYYFNVHSPTYPDGEIRGQIVEKAPTQQQIQKLQQLQQQSQQLSQQLQLLQQQAQQSAGPVSGTGTTGTTGTTATMGAGT